MRCSKLPGIPRFIWINQIGRDREGELENRIYLIGPDGTLMFYVERPQVGEMGYKATRRVWSKGAASAQDDCSQEFLEEGPAVRWCEQQANRYLDSLAQTAVKKKKRKPRKRATA